MFTPNKSEIVFRCEKVLGASPIEAERGAASELKRLAKKYSGGATSALLVSEHYMTVSIGFARIVAAELDAALLPQEA